MRAALYARVSTEDQATEGYSLDAQMKSLEAYCRSRGWTPAGRYVDDGYSGRNTERPAYKEMMDFMDDWDVLLVLKMDRIHRNSVNFTGMMHLLNKKGKEFNSIREKFDTTTAMGRFVMDIMQRIAQLESEQIGERVRMGMERKARCGTGTLGSGHPYGYVYSGGMLHVDVDEALTVRTMYKLYVKGMSMEDISRTLNDASIPAKKGGKWNKQSVHGILHNPLYAGFIKWDGIIRKGDHSAIIDPLLFHKVNGYTPA
ncbi:MAG: recombinase family protein [Methanomassiliicoccaceae archaeon]|nr:recombinase family protein [Methanomassiliicoccaceae archaeon]